MTPTVILHKRSKLVRRSNGILTIAEVARYTLLSPSTIRRLFDEKQFPDAFTIPLSTHRRLPAPGVVAFMRRLSMPVPKELEELSHRYLLSTGKITVEEFQQFQTQQSSSVLTAPSTLGKAAS